MTDLFAEDIEITYGIYYEINISTNLLHTLFTYLSIFFTKLENMTYAIVLG